MAASLKCNYVPAASQISTETPGKIFSPIAQEVKTERVKRIEVKSRMARRLICHLIAKSLLEVRGKGNSSGDARGCFHFRLRPCSVYFLISVPLPYPLNWQFAVGNEQVKTNWGIKGQKNKNEQTSEWIPVHRRKTLYDYSCTVVRQYTITRVRTTERWMRQFIIVTRRNFAESTNL